MTPFANLGWEALIAGGSLLAFLYLLVTRGDRANLRVPKFLEDVMKTRNELDKELKEAYAELQKGKNEAIEKRIASLEHRVQQHEDHVRATMKDIGEAEKSKDSAAKQTSTLVPSILQSGASAYKTVQEVK